MSEEPVKQKRQYFRLRYPKRARPVVRVKDRKFSVAEVSEKGLRVVMANTSTLYRGMSMKGVLLLHGDKLIEIDGAVLRFEGDEVILKLKQGPSFKQMFSEQIRLRRKYPFLFNKK